MTSAPLPPVQRDEASADFFDAAAQGRLLLRRCTDCGHVRSPEVPMCTECISEASEWLDAAGTGHVESWVVIHSKPGADGVVPEPRVVVTVELTEGPWMVSALTGLPADAVTGGMPVVVAFERPDDSEAIPVFHRA